MATAETSNLPPELVAMQVEIEEYARGHGLDLFPTIFEYIDADQLNAIAAKGGFPVRYPHWRFGMEYERLSKGYHHGLQKIYEMVINNDPCYAYLMTNNALTDQKLVMAHVYGHCDFFKNNFWFSKTSRKMMDEMANHGNRVRRYMDEVGVEEVEEFIDACLSLEDQIDIHSPFIRRRDEKSRYDFGEQDQAQAEVPARFRAKDYMDAFINPRDKLAAAAKEMEEKRREPKQFPERPERDVLLFLLEHAPLNSWQADVLSIIRDEAYYFAPQGQTKIMNEGWASYWHSKIMTRHGLNDSELIDYAAHHSGTMATSRNRLNPYKLGIELLKDIEERWNRGQFGPEYDDCTDALARAKWDKQLGLGRQKIFEVRRVHNDVTFIDTYLTPEFCVKQNLFEYKFNESTNYYEIASREFRQIKTQL